MYPFVSSHLTLIGIHTHPDTNTPTYVYIYIYIYIYINKYIYIYILCVYVYKRIYASTFACLYTVLSLLSLPTDPLFCSMGCKNIYKAPGKIPVIAMTGTRPAFYPPQCCAPFLLLLVFSAFMYIPFPYTTYSPCRS